MDRNEQIAASARRVIKLKTEAVRHEAVAAVRMASAQGWLRSGAHILSIERICVDGYRELSRTAAIQIAEIEGEGASQHAELLSVVLCEAQADILEAFGSYASPGQSDGTFANFTETRRAEVQKSMDDILQGTVDDLSLGIAGGLNVKKQKGGIAIDNRGGSGQFNVNSPNASQSVGRDQIAGGGFDPAELMGLLRQVREEVTKAEVPPAARDEIEDAILSAEREITSPTPDPGRVRRLLGAVGRTARDFGVAVAAAVVSSQIQRMGN